MSLKEFKHNYPTATGKQLTAYTKLVYLICTEYSTEDINSLTTHQKGPRGTTAGHQSLVIR